MRLLLLILYVIFVGVCATTETLPISKKQFKYLAENVCSDLIPEVDNNTVYEANLDECTTLLQDSKTSPEPETNKVICINKKTVKVNFNQYHEQQILIVVPKNNTSNRIIEYSLIDDNESSTIINLEPNADIWISDINSSGKHYLWKRYLQVPDCTNVKLETFIIKIKKYSFYKNTEGYLKIQAMFEWNSSKSDMISVTNICDTWEFPKKIKPTNLQSVIVPNLDFGDVCTIMLNDAYGKGELQYHTPLCYNDTYCGPSLLGNITVESDISSSSSKHDIKIRWTRPDHLPDSYNITLITDRNRKYNAPLPGSSTEFTFYGIEGESEFDVILRGIWPLGSKAVHRRGILSSSEPSQLGVILAGTLCLLLSGGIIVASAAVCVRKRRNRSLRKTSFQTLEESLHKIYTESSTQDLSIPDDCWEVRPDRLALHEVIGEGAFGVVRRGSLAPEGKEVAVKMLKIFPSVEEVRSFRAEMELMKSVGAHPHVVSLVGCYSGRRPMIIAEYCSQGDLLNYLRSSWDVMLTKRNAKYHNNNIEYISSFSIESETQGDFSRLAVNKLYDLQTDSESELSVVDLLSFCRQIVLGMEFLAMNRVVHRDLAARNVLVTKDKTLKIADFGLSRDVYQENQYKQKGTGKLPFKWMALESLTNKVYTTQSDVWSFGVVMWEIVTLGASPYPDVHATRLLRFLKDGYRMPRPHNCSMQLYELMLSCWRARPRDRPTFSELHARLDALLNGACADDYLTLEIQYEPPALPPNNNPYKYFRFIPRRKRAWCKRLELYEKPVEFSSNHYTEAPESKSNSAYIQHTCTICSQKSEF